jgi:hypothetical protein
VRSERKHKEIEDKSKRQDQQTKIQFATPKPKARESAEKRCVLLSEVKMEFEKQESKRLEAWRVWVEVYDLELHANELDFLIVD